MKKMFISLAVASASLLYSQVANADDGLSKEEAINVLNSAIVDIHMYKEDMKDMIKISNVREKMPYYNPMGTTEEQLLNQYNEDLKEIKQIKDKTYTVNNKEVKPFNDTGTYGVILSSIPGDIAYFKTFVLNEPEFPVVNNFGGIEAHEISGLAYDGLRFSEAIESEYEQTVDVLKNSYEKPELESNSPFSNEDKTDVENLLIEDIKGLNQISERMYQNKEFAFQAMSDTTAKFIRNSLDIKYELNKVSMERTTGLAGYKGTTLISDRGFRQEPYTTINNEVYVEVNVQELNANKIQVYDMDGVLPLADMDIKTRENATEAYQEILTQLNIVEKAKKYYVGLLEEMGSSKIPKLVEETSFATPEQNKKEAQLLTNSLVNKLNSIQDTIKELKSISYEAYTNEEKKDNTELKKQFEQLKYQLFFDIYEMNYNGVYLLDEYKDLDFYFDENNISKPSFILELKDLSDNYIFHNQSNPYSNPPGSDYALSAAYIEETLKQIKEDEKLVNNYKKYVLEAEAKLNGISIEDKAEIYNQKITVFEKLPLYRSADISTKTNATVSPQTVNAFERKGDWVRIKSYLGDVYIKPTFYLEGKKEVVETKIETLKRLHLHDLPASDSVSNATVAPQQLYALYKVGDWYAINTWLGVKFVKPDFVEEEYNAYLTSTERLNLYNEPSLDSVNGGTLNPQTLKILKRKGEFLQVQTWMGPKYIKPAKDAPGRILDVTKQIELTKRVSLHTLPGSDYVTAQSLAPQKVNVVGELSNGSGWTLIHTWLGNRWVKL